SSLKTAVKIYRGDVSQVRESDIVVANCNSFRGALMDDGTAYELGYGNALSKPSYGYVSGAETYIERVTKRYPCHILKGAGTYADKDGYLLVDDFGTRINLMMQCGMVVNGGRLVIGGFECCLRTVRYDLDNGALKLRRR
ncbi:MAG: nucleoside 2-deoxyribosyltransferase, partial [Patescibacteria group bacterium]